MFHSVQISQFPNKSIISTSEYEKLGNDELITANEKVNDELIKLTEEQKKHYEEYKDRFQVYLKILNETDESFTNIEYVKNVYQSISNGIEQRYSYFKMLLTEQMMMGIMMSNKDYLMSASPTFKLINEHYIVNKYNRNCEEEECSKNDENCFD